MRAFAALLCVLVLGGCGTPAPIVRVDASRAPVPPGLTSLCSKIPPLKKPSTMGDLLEHDDHMIGLYAVCAQKNASKAEYLKSLDQPSHVR